MRSDSHEGEAEADAETQRPHEETAQEDTSEDTQTPKTTQEDTKDTSEDPSQQPDDEDADPEAIHVRILDLNGKFFNITCRLDWTVAHMKQKVQESTEVAVPSQRLIYRGRVLEDDNSLDSYKVEDGHTIHLFVRAAPTPDPEILNAELNANGSSSGAREDGITVVNINSDIVSSAVFPSDSARRVDPLMLDSPLGNCARRVKLWSSFLLIIYTMKVMGQFALLANDQQQRAAQQEREGTGASETDPRPMERYDEYPQFYTPDPLIGGIELLVHCFGVYVGCVGFKAAHDTDIRPIRFYCRGVVWLAILTVAEQIYTTVQISQSDFPTERVQYPYGGQGPTKDDIVSANIFQTIMLVVMWLIAIRHSYLHQREVSIYNQSFAVAAMNAAPPVHLPEVV
ncbi:Ubiquitin family protein [Phytophthora megakarya]|uniref:Ubiquitin family protein n=1 Tax=Phytophthora megakarya TaxID=4795 RepID=A0A225X1U5_9STRA|nr:Ubiquitin family protein [Phytophthora megakarya]